jgi:hypothetical protein
MNNNQHLAFPFANQAELVIKTKSKKTSVQAELASSVIEIFQSACFRKPSDLTQPLVLQFGDPTLQHFTLQNFSFKVEQILVEAGSNKIVGIYWHHPNQAKGNVIQGFSGLSCVILATPGFAEKHKIDLKDTRILIK